MDSGNAHRQNIRNFGELKMGFKAEIFIFSHAVALKACIRTLEVVEWKCCL
jgi:hypothetical protein